MLLHHDGVHGLGVTESKETEASRAASGAVAHYSAFLNIAELREILS